MYVSRGVYNQAVMFIGHKSIWFSHFFSTNSDKKSAYCIFLSIFDPTKLTRKFATEAGESIGHSGQIFRKKFTTTDAIFTGCSILKTSQTVYKFNHCWHNYNKITNQNQKISMFIYPKLREKQTNVFIEDSRIL